jgi:hypothetical protein
MQVRSRSVAALTALLFVMGGLLSARHEAATTHVRDRAGAFLHAGALTGTHTGHDADIHGQRDPHSDTAECALLTASHQPASAAIASPALTSTARTATAHAAPRAAATHAARDVYRLAPKTSPPGIA